MTPCDEWPCLQGMRGRWHVMSDPNQKTHKLGAYLSGLLAREIRLYFEEHGYA